MRKEKPSRTAYKVALNILTLGAKPGMEKVLPPGVVEATDRLLIASGAARERVVRWFRSPKMVSVYKAFDWMMPGQFEAFGYRKAFCERQIREGIGAGATQVLVLGAGYDTMGWRLTPEFTNVNFFEIDHPATARKKAKGIKELGLRDNLYLYSEDLGKRKLVEVLKNSESWDQTAQTIIIAEGLLMYLPPEAVHDLLCQCSLVTGIGSRIVFSYVSQGANGLPDVGRWTGLVLWLLKMSGEPWLWSIQPNELGSFLEKTGWKNTPELLGTKDMHGVEFFDVATK